MTRSQVENEVLKRFLYWTDEYLDRSFNSVEDLKAYRLKRDHTIRVLEAAKRIVELSSSMDEETRTIVTVSAILHDVGRFAQWRAHKDFCDVAEQGHHVIGAEMLEKGLIKYFIPWTRDYDEILILAVREHTEAELPQDLSARELEVCKLLRDADRIDIFYQSSTDQDFEVLYCQDWGETTLSNPVRKAFEEDRTILFDDVKSKFDMLALRLALCKQMSCKASLEYLLDDDTVNRMVGKFKERLRSADGNFYYNDVECEWLRRDAIKKIEERWREM